MGWSVLEKNIFYYKKPTCVSVCVCVNTFLSQILLSILGGSERVWKSLEGSGRVQEGLGGPWEGPGGRWEGPGGKFEKSRPSHHSRGMDWSKRKTSFAKVVDGPQKPIEDCPGRSWEDPGGSWEGPGGSWEGPGGSWEGPGGEFEKSRPSHHTRGIGWS